jgi:hypothetical protein
MPRAPRVSDAGKARIAATCGSVLVLLGTVRELYPNDGNLAGAMSLLKTFGDGLSKPEEPENPTPES